MSAGRLANLRPFEPGKSGNPGGRTSEVAKALAFCQSKSEAAMRGLWAIAEGSKDERVKLVAYDKILDRALGKPKEIKADDSAGIQKRLELKTILSVLNDDELAALQSLYGKLRRMQAQADAAPIDVTPGEASDAEEPE